MLICWNDIKIHLGFEDSYFVPPPTYSQPDRKYCFFTSPLLSLSDNNLLRAAFAILAMFKAYY